MLWILRKELIHIWYCLNSAKPIVECTHAKFNVRLRVTGSIPISMFKYMTCLKVARSKKTLCWLTLNPSLLQTTGNEMHTRKNEKRGHSVSISHPLYSMRNDYGLDLKH